MIYLKIAGFCIWFNLEDPQDRPFSKKLLVDNINKYLSGFIDPEEKNSDFKINMKQEVDNDVIYKKDEKSFYFKIFEVGGNQINCNYEISFGQISFIIRYAILMLLYKNNGFLMHGSAIAINNKAYIFTGPSGAGKSTIMKILSSKYVALADDSVIIKKEMGEYYLYQTPIIEKESWVKKQSKKYLIEKIFFLNKSKDFKIEKDIDKKRVIMKLLNQLFTNQDQTKKQVTNMIEFIKRFDNFGTISFSKNKKKLLDFFLNCVSQ